MTTYYVGPGGNDANAGTSWALRKLTINGAEDIPVAAGDTVYVGPGTYRELLTVDVSGTAGNVITYIGDYTGANTSGLKGIVRITGSADDIALTRANCITATSKNYRTFRGFACDLTSSNAINLTSCTYTTIDKCHVASPSGCILVDGASTSNITVSNCVLSPGGATNALAIQHSGTGVAVASVIQNCIAFGAANTGNGFIVNRVNGVTASNCVAVACNDGFRVGIATTVAGSFVVNNSISAFNNNGFRSAAAGELTEDYNTVFGCSTARSNVTAGANSVARPPLFDVRWFFEAVNGGRFITLFDLASYSTLVEYNSGTGAPATDMRGASVVSTYREWGALEYSANYRAQGPVSIEPLGGIG